MESKAEKDGFSAAPDNRKIGEFLASAAAKDFPAGSVGLLVHSVSGSSGVCERLAAAEETLSAAGISVLHCDDPAAWERLRAQADFCILPEPAFLGEITELLSRQKDSLPLYAAGYSQKLTSGLENGQIAAAAVWSGYAEGYWAVEQAVLGKQAKPLEIPIILVRREDMYEAENQKILFPIGN